MTEKQLFFLSLIRKHTELTITQLVHYALVLKDKEYKRGSIRHIMMRLIERDLVETFFDGKEKLWNQQTNLNLFGYYNHFLLQHFQFCTFFLKTLLK